MRGFAVRALGEIAIRARDMAAMKHFYGEVLGLPMLSERPNGIAFFRLGDGFAGHTAVLALFPAEVAPEAGEGSSLHHLALSLPWAEQAAALRWLTGQGLPVHVEDFDWIGWRGVFTRDPDGNTVELVAARPQDAA